MKPPPGKPLSPVQILAATSGIFHPPLAAVRELRKLLQSAQADFAPHPYHVQFTRFGAPMEALARHDLSRVQVVVLYFHQMTISPKALAVFDQYVARGGGVLAIHSVTASFKQTLDFFNIIGGRFTGHGEVEAIEMLPIPGSPIFGDLPSFTVTDELYLHEQQPGIEPHFTAAHQGQRVPLVWTHHYGEGRVCYACPGHTRSALQHPVYQQILRRGLKWASGI